MNSATQAQPTKPKNIVICSDGTGNSAIKDRGTNVFKLYEAVDVNGHLNNSALTPQITFYDDGVGTETFKPLKVLGGAFGWGLSRNVKELYAGLVRSYDHGDKIFLFGFSRGAYTVRALGGFISACGILDHNNRYATDADLVGAVGEAYEVYRSKYMMGIRHDVQTLRQKLAPQSAAPSQFDVKVASFRKQHAVHDERIAFIGVWDTVDVVGFPIAGVAAFINYVVYPYKFSDLTLSLKVDQARHALSIDDERYTFHPYMWAESPTDHDRIKQAWFSGVHANVGGGYPKQGMSLVSLDWMMVEAERAGLRFIADDRSYYHDHQNVNDKLYNSRAGLAVYYRYKPRDIHKICMKSNTTAKIHETVIDRIKQCTEGYAPGNLPAGLTVVATGGHVTRHPNAGNVITSAYGKDTSLLDRVKSQVWIRRISHYVFLLLSLLALVYAVWPVFAKQQGTVAVLGALFSMDIASVLSIELFTDWWFDMIVVLIGVFYLIGLWAEHSMGRKFSAFWHPVRPLL